jgi:DNA mismatch endonuclease (patch repair protein)
MAPPLVRMVNLGGGRVVPYPDPADAAASKVGKANRRKDTKPEIRLRSALHRRGFRFRKDHLLRCGEVRVRPDIVFTRRRVAVFVDGCFWHGCPDHQHVPSRNRAYWVPKLQGNMDRDRRVDAALIAAGWFVVRVWEHVDVKRAAEEIELCLEQRGLPRAGGSWEASGSPGGGASARTVLLSTGYGDVDRSTAESMFDSASSRQLTDSHNPVQEV